MHLTIMYYPLLEGFLWLWMNRKRIIILTTFSMGLLITSFSAEFAETKKWQMFLIIMQMCIQSSNCHILYCESSPELGYEKLMGKCALQSV